MRLIPLTAEHIAKGKRADCNRCPVALAVADAGYRTVTVQQWSLRLNGRRDCYIMYPIAHWIRNFDRLPMDRFSEPKPLTLVLMDRSITTLNDWQGRRREC